MNMTRFRCVCCVTKQALVALGTAVALLAGGSTGRAVGQTGTSGQSGVLNTPNLVTKLPKVDVRNSDFGMGCANAADATGQQDSTCAIEAAIAWTQANTQGLTNAQVYLPAGTYKISSALYVPCNIHFVGDGEMATIIEQTNNSANIVTVYSGGGPFHQPNLWSCNGSIENMTLHAPGGHLFTATLLELQNAVGYNVSNIRGSNGGGRGLATIGSTERLKIFNTEWDTVRWPMVILGNEVKVYATQIESPGADASGYCYDNNCPGGVYPGYSWTKAQTLVSANGNGTTATYVVKGGNNSSSSNGISPMVAGHYFTVAGIPDVTALNGVYQIVSVTNHSPANDEYTVTANSTARGTGIITRATYKPTLRPSNQIGAIYFVGNEDNFYSGSIKTTWHEPCFEAAAGVMSGVIDGFYCEGYSVNGMPTVNADVLVGGLQPWTTFTSASGTGTGAVAVASTNNFPFYLNNPSDISRFGNGIEYVIEPQDYVKGSTAPSAYVSGVTQRQYELISGWFAGDGNLHIMTRNDSGSTAHRGTNWPAGSIVAKLIGGSGYGTVRVSSMHMNSLQGGNTNWAYYCNDANQYICAEAVVGSIPNGYTTYSTANGSGGAPAADFLDDEHWYAAPGGYAGEPFGMGFIKVSLRGTVTQTGVLGGWVGETSEALQGQFNNNDHEGQMAVYAVTEADGSTAWMAYSVPTTGTSAIVNITGSPLYQTQIYTDGSTDSVLGSNPYQSGAAGWQYANSTCIYDVPPGDQKHALNRFCLTGGPKNTGARAGWQYDVWNGLAWVNAFGISAQNNSTANAVVSGSLAAAEILAQPNKESQEDIYQGRIAGGNPFYSVTYQGTIKSNAGIALSTVLNTASALTLTTANKNVIANATRGAQTIILPSCSTPLPDKALPTGLEFTIIKSDPSSNPVTLRAIGAEKINYAGVFSASLSITSPGKRTVICAPDYNWYAY